jgi:hypothetical protein
MCDPTAWNPPIGTFMKIIGARRGLHGAAELAVVTLSSHDFTHSADDGGAFLVDLAA